MKAPAFFNFPKVGKRDINIRLRLYESGIRKSFSILLRFSPIRETFQTLYDFRKNLLILLQENEPNKTDKNFVDEDFWDFIDETLRNYKKAKKGGK